MCANLPAGAAAFASMPDRPRWLPHEHWGPTNGDLPTRTAPASPRVWAGARLRWMLPARCAAPRATWLTPTSRCTAGARVRGQRLVQTCWLAQTAVPLMCLPGGKGVCSHNTHASAPALPLTCNAPRPTSPPHPVASRHCLGQWLQPRLVLAAPGAPGVLGLRGMGRQAGNGSTWSGSRLHACAGLACLTACLHEPGCEAAAHQPRHGCRASALCVSCTATPPHIHPQMTLYVPGPVLREGSNEVVLLEVERAARDTAGEPCVRGWAGMSLGLLAPAHLGMRSVCLQTTWAGACVKTRMGALPCSQPVPTTHPFSRCRSGSGRHARLLGPLGCSGNPPTADTPQPRAVTARRRDCAVQRPPMNTFPLAQPLLLARLHHHSACMAFGSTHACPCFDTDRRRAGAHFLNHLVSPRGRRLDHEGAPGLPAYITAPRSL